MGENRGGWTAWSNDGGSGGVGEAGGGQFRGLSSAAGGRLSSQPGIAKSGRICRVKCRPVGRPMDHQN
jgi:hypothetical protein